MLLFAITHAQLAGVVACVVAYNIITYTTYVESYATVDGARAPPRHAYAGAGARIACARYARTRAYATATPRAAASPASCSDSSASCHRRDPCPRLPQQEAEILETL